MLRAENRLGCVVFRRDKTQFNDAAGDVCYPHVMPWRESSAFEPFSHNADFGFDAFLPGVAICLNLQGAGGM